MTITLSPTQHAVLDYAIHKNAGAIAWFPATVKGGARKKVLEGLTTRGLVHRVGADWIVSDAGYEAMGCAQEARGAPAVTEAEVTPAQLKTRAHSKQAEIIEMLKRPEGVTINQIMAATGWQAHTVRGTFAGAFKKKLGLAITSGKQPGGERIYRISAGI